MNKTRLLQGANAAFLLATVAVNMLANVLSFGGNTTGQVSAAYPTLFTPAPATFFIWGVIYLLMAVFALYQLELLPKCRDGAYAGQKAGLWFIVSCILNMAWILAWHYRLLGLSLLFMVGLVFCLAKISLRFDFDAAQNWASRLSIGGFQIYLGWLTAAAIANLGVFLTQIRWDGFGISAETWTILALMAGMVLGSAFALIRNLPFATVAVIWAYTGIVMRHVSSSGFDLAYPLVVAAALFAIVFMMAAITICRIRINERDFALQRRFDFEPDPTNDAQAA